MYTKIKEIITNTRDTLYFIPSLDIQVPKKRLKVKKCNQKSIKKLSVENIVYKLSRLKYNLTISKNGSFNKLA